MHWFFTFPTELNSNDFILFLFQVTGVFSKEYIPQGTRFGPLQGEIYTKDNVPKQANRKYFWRVREHM